MGTLDGNSLIKKPHTEQKYTDQQIRELALCSDPIAGPNYFLGHFFHIQHPTRGSILYAPYEYQTRLIDTYHAHRFSVSMMPRQTGKCLIAETRINVKNNLTEKEYNIPVGVYNEFIRSQNSGSPSPDISIYELKK
jgi:hypothetical protein